MLLNSGKIVLDKTKLEGVTPVEIKNESDGESRTEYEYNIPEFKNSNEAVLAFNVT